MPQTVIRRRILESDSYYNALNVPFSLRQQIPANLVITDRSGFTINLETTPARHRWIYASEGILVHANHYEEDVPDQISADYRPFSVDSLFRSPILRGRLRSAAHAMRGPEPSVLMDCLGDHFGYPYGVCRHPDSRDPEHLQSKTIASAVVDLTSGRYFLAPGNPCDTAYELLPWNLYDDGPRPGGNGTAEPTTMLTSSCVGTNPNRP
ncbi:carcinine hydrolase/isopenicillin-N N-acyltransferase family protein [Mycobacterium sp. MS1601]|uniref:carcinine hydrolase/isopenicillin-N N-acyltransferase family protein n=1 Tax=Mycobacterium sp. MS1601 TaxID=1936029 RepID=UPI00178CD698|nr:carcinine hydrolase/isopenicillin-N N-acyltransferase family protein [Mycobacterium sp. MS1601]